MEMLRRYIGSVLLGASLLILSGGKGVVGQSNYASHGNSIEYSNEGLPDSTVLDGKVTKLDDISPVIFLNRTKAALNCAAGYMQIELKFDEPFYGIAYADFDRASACQVAGRGDTSARIDLPLKGCGTKQDPQRVFTNNIVVRFHPALEMDGDEVITIVCRYPPPIAPPPAGVPSFIKEEPIPALPLAPPLKGFQILLIICGILFLSLVLLGLGCSYYLLKRRRVQVVRRHPLSTGTGSEITKLSGSSLGNISMFEGLKIPRAHAQPAGSTSGSEAALISGADTLPSDYPSESPSSAHSEVEDIDTRSLRRSVSSGGSFDNKGFVQETFYEEYGQKITTEVVTKRPPPPEPKFDVQVRVKKAAPPPPPTPTPPPSESDISLKTAERNLTTILEEDRSQQNIKTTFTYVPEIHAPPAKLPTPPPVYSTIVRKHPQVTKTVATTEERYIIEDTVDVAQRRSSLASLNTEMTDTRSMSEIVERTPTKYSPPPAPIPPPSQELITEMETVEIVEPPLVASRRPEIKSHVVDDVFLRTITEKRTIEDIERHRRKVTEYRKAQAPPTKWDVTIRNYPGPDSGHPDDSTTDWESYSESSSMSGYPNTNNAYRTQMNNKHIEVEHLYRTTMNVPQTDKTQNWDVLVRILEPPIYDVPDDRSDVTSIVDQALTLEDRQKWKEIITTESTLRTMLTEATVKEDYERIRKDQRYEKLFEPQKWDVIIRVLAPPPQERHQFDQKGAGSSGNKYKRKADWDTRSRRSSLPTLYEYDSDGCSSVRTLTGDSSSHSHHPGSLHDPRSRRTSRSSMRSEMDLRSMSEMTVDFARGGDALSDVSSSYYQSRRYLDDDYLGGVARVPHSSHLPISDDEDARSLVRSMSQPSLARSASEFTEHWAVRPRHWELSSPEHSPRSSSRSRRGGGIGRNFAGSSSYQMTETHYQQSHGWFADGDSEASYK